MRRQREGTAFWKPVPDLGHTFRYRYVTSINELTTLVAPELIPGSQWDPDDIIKEIETAIDVLVKRNLIMYETEPSNITFRGKQYEGFYIVPKGKAFVRKCFLGLENLVSNKVQYESAIDQVNTGSEVKNYLRGLRTKFSDKSQDEIVEIIIPAAKYAPAGIAMILRLVGIHSQNS